RRARAVRRAGARRPRLLRPRPARPRPRRDLHGRRPLHPGAAHRRRREDLEPHRLRLRVELRRRRAAVQEPLTGVGSKTVQAVLSFAAALVALRLGGGLLRRWRARRAPELAAWAGSLLAYALA